jgi:hypothetical protein
MCQGSAEKSPKLSVPPAYHQPQVVVALVGAPGLSFEAFRSHGDALRSFERFLNVDEHGIYDSIFYIINYMNYIYCI